MQKGLPVVHGSETDLTALKARLPSVVLGGRIYYVAEGDLVLAEADLPQYLASYPKRADRSVPTSERTFGLGSYARPSFIDLVAVKRTDNSIVRWPNGTVLTYKIRNDFENDAARAQVQADLATAAADWESACNIHFKRLDIDDPAKPIFDVSYDDSADVLFALSFFPEDPEDRRTLSIMSRYFEDETKAMRPGILRHELGHILGFRHENDSPNAPSDCPKDKINGQLVQVTPYDPQSVMHYFCGQMKNMKLVLTESDRAGAAKVYGPPNLTPQ